MKMEINGLHLLALIVPVVLAVLGAGWIFALFVFSVGQAGACWMTGFLNQLQGPKQ